MKKFNFFINFIPFWGVISIAGCQILFKGLLKPLFLTALNYLTYQQEKYQKNSNHVGKYLPWL